MGTFYWDTLPGKVSHSPSGRWDTLPGRVSRVSQFYSALGRGVEGPWR